MHRYIFRDDGRITEETKLDLELARGLRSRACFKKDKTRQDWRALPELAKP